MPNSCSTLGWILLLLGLFGGATWRTLLVNGDIFPECDGVADDEFVASPLSCRSYIYCLGEDSMLGECNENEYFDRYEMTCDLRENVECPLDIAVDEEPEVEEASPEDIVEYPDVEEEPTGQQQQQQQQQQTVATNPPPAVQTTPARPQENQGNGVAETVDPLNIESIVRDTCPLSDNPNEIVLMPNKESCSDYYLCYHGNAIEMHCTDHLHFNVNTGKCDFPEKVQCVIERPNATKCLAHTIDFFPHPDKCNYFYYCIRGFLTVQQCPFYYGWDIEKRSCVHISKAKCHKNAKRA